MQHRKKLGKKLGKLLRNFLVLSTTICTLVIAGQLQALPNYPGLYFQPNEGQTDAAVEFLAYGPGYQVYLTQQDITVSTKSKSIAANEEPQHNVARLKFLNASEQTKLVGENPRQAAVNYFRGQNPNSWQTNIPTYGKVRYPNVYPGVDVVVRDSDGQLEYDFVVAPGANPDVIKMAIERNADAKGDVTLLSDGSIQVPLDASGKEHIFLSKPYVYQTINNNEIEIAGAFKLSAAEAGLARIEFELGDYDTAYSLVIDPVLTTSTYLGGFGQDVGTSVTTDASGSAYLFGSTNAPNFPTLNPVQASPGGGGASDAFVAKFSSDGTTMLYATYIGGALDDVAASGGNARGAIKVDSQGNAVVAAATASSDFPLVNAIQTEKGGGSSSFLNDAFVTKLNAAGNGLLFSTYLGGSDTESALDLDLDSSGNIYVTGATSSGDFPTTTGVVQDSLASAGLADAYITKISADGSEIMISTYLGGGSGISPQDEGTGIEVDTVGNVYLGGNTGADNFPLVNPIQTGSGGDFPAFVAKLNSSLTSLIYSTLVIGGKEEIAYGLAIDGSGAAYLVGTTESAGFPTTVGAYQTTFAGERDAFLVKINPAGDAFEYATLFGGSAEDYALNGTMDVAVDEQGNAYILGTTESNDLPTANPIQAANNGAHDLFIAKFDPAGENLLFGSYLGGSNTDISGGLALDANGDLFLIGATFSTDFPLQQAFQTNLAISGTDAVFAKILDDSPSFDTSIVAAVLPGTRVGVVGTTVTAFATILNAGENTATACEITNLTSIPANFSYQPTDANNAPVGNANEPVDISPGAGQSFVVSFEITGAFALTDIVLGFDCQNSSQAPSSAANAFQLTGSASATADVIALAATLNNDGIVRLDQDPSGSGATLNGVFSVSTANVGSAGDTFTLSADSDSDNTGTLVTTLVCQTNPVSGACMANPTGSVTLFIDAGETPTFGFFPSTIGPGAGGEPVVFDPSLNRVFVRLTNSSSVTTTATSVAVTTQ